MSSNLHIKRICQYCTKEFTARTTVTKYCSHKCNSAAYKSKKRDEKVEQSNKEVFNIKTEPIERVNAKEFLTVKNVAVLLNCSVRTVYRLIEQGDIKAVNLSQRKILVRRPDIDSLFKEHSKPEEVESPKDQLQAIDKLEQIGQFDIEDYYTLKEIQDKYLVSASALHNLIKRNNIPKIKKGWYAYVPKQIIDELLN